MWKICACIVVLLASTTLAGGIGTGFGENLGQLVSARQAGTGGLALEDPWREGTLADASGVFLDPTRWVGLGGQGGLGSRLRMGFEAYLFEASSPQTLEQADGTFGGWNGEATGEEWGGRVLAQYTLWNGDGWRLAALGRVSGVVLKLPDAMELGGGVEAGAQAARTLTPDQGLTAWVLAGPLGYGGSRFFSAQFLAGGGWLIRWAEGPGSRPGGAGIGVEVQGLSEGLLHGGLGAVTWIGAPRGEGTTYFLRAGMRSMASSAQAVQPRGGFGVLWRGAEGGWGIQLDYALAPLGELGLFQYATLSLRKS